MTQFQNSLTRITASQERTARERHNPMALSTKSLDKATKDYQ